jgi:hypothetical protein
MNIKIVLASVSLLAGPQAAFASGYLNVLKWHGRGSQIYSCSAGEGRFAWALKEPDATLTDFRGRIRGRNERGPAWTATDGSRVIGGVLTQIPAPTTGAIPWLILRAVRHEGHGLLERVSYILRIDTAGGLSPKAGCDAAHNGAVVRVRYQATYLLLSPDVASLGFDRQADRDLR